MSTLMQIARFIPSVIPPEKRLSFKEKLMWTSIIILIYFVMGQVSIFGAAPGRFQQLGTLQTILGSSIGTLLTLGIGPIITASIILQMLVGSNIIPWNLQAEDDKQKFQAAQKLFAYTLCIVEGIAFVAFGAVQPAGPGFGLFALVAGQVALGGCLIVLMDEVVSKWGFSSGISLFIAAGVSQSIITGFITPFTSNNALWFLSGGDPLGALPQVFTGIFDQATLIAAGSTILVFFVVVYAQQMKVEIPLTFGNVRGFGRKWPLDFVYTNVMPVILIGALLANLQLWAGMLAEQGVTLQIGDFYIIGNYSLNSAASPNTLIYYLSVTGQEVLNIINGNFSAHLFISIFTYTVVFTLGCMAFSLFWMKTSGQDPKSVADQIHNMGMNIPGFRQDKRVIEKLLNRYIPPLSVLGGAFIGILAAFANLTNAFGGGTGILLTVMIIFRLYKELAQHHLEEMNPRLRQFMQTS